MPTLDELVQASAARHRLLCPRQVLGVRIGMLAGRVLSLNLPQTDKRLLAIVETDGCATDGVAVATNCWVGRRTMPIEDYGKVAATFVDTHTRHTVRIAPRPEARQLARALAPKAGNEWEAQLWGYQRMPAEVLLSIQTVQLHASIEQLISRAGQRTICETCGEEIMNEREVLREGTVLCKCCAGQSYYRIVTESAAPHVSHTDKMEAAM